MEFLETIVTYTTGAENDPSLGLDSLCDLQNRIKSARASPSTITCRGAARFLTDFNMKKYFGH